eukprot:gene13383-9583_t
MAVPEEETTVENDGDNDNNKTATATATSRSSSRTTAKRTSSPNTPAAAEQPTAIIQAAEPSAKRSRRSGKQPRLDAEEPRTTATTAVPSPAPPSSSSSSVAAVVVAAVVPGATASSSAEEAAAVNVDDDDDGIVLLFTKLEESAFQRYLRRLPQIRVTNDAREATHVLTTPELKRTPKLLVALNHRVRFVVTEAWLIDSAKQQRPLPLLPATCSPAQMSEPAYGQALQQSCRYLVRDEEKETLWQFRLSDTLARIRYHPAATRRIFGRVAFFVTRGLLGETAPSVEDMRAIVESAGGVLAAASRSTTGSSATSSGLLVTDAAAAAGDALRGRTLVVVSHPSVVKKEIPRDLLQRLRRQATATQQAADSAAAAALLADWPSSLLLLRQFADP